MSVAAPIQVSNQPGSSASGPLVVALLYNWNGMAAWCWEAAHALKEQGRDVLLVAAEGLALPATAEVEVLRVDPSPTPSSHPRGLPRLAAGVAAHLASGPDGLLKKIHYRLALQGELPAAYILNQSSLADPAVPCRQAVAAWSYPTSLTGYLAKLPLLVPDASLRALLRTALSSIGWWRRDWRAYRTTDAVLSVTQALQAALLQRGVRCTLAYPGTSVPAEVDREPGGPRLLMAAAHLGEPRKRVLWMLDALRGLNPPQGAILQFAGEASPTVRAAASQTGLLVEFLGRIQREALQQLMRRAHIFCFGSLLDDWGYVLVEAMANGMVPIAPAISPFNEILGGVGFSYKLQSQRDFRRAVHSALSRPLADASHQAHQRAQTHFSRQAFGLSILQSLQLEAAEPTSAIQPAQR